MFYGDNERPGAQPLTPAELAAARRVCHYCPSRSECLSEALITDERFGVWGGFTGAERGRILTRYADKHTGKPVMPAVLRSMREGTLEAQVVML